MTKLRYQLFARIIIDCDRVYRADTSRHFRIEFLTFGDISHVEVTLDFVAPDEYCFACIAVLDELLPHLDEGDVVMDSGNSFWRDSMRREQRVWEDGIYFLDAGTSGGPPGARTGGCFMVGGRKEGFDTVEPILDKLSVDKGLVYTGRPGTGHFVKLVHNDVDFGMLQSIVEEIELIEASSFDLDMTAIVTNWSHGSVIRSWLVELMAKGLRHEEQFEDAPDFEDVPIYAEDAGEVNWLVEEAIKGKLLFGSSRKQSWNCSNHAEISNMSTKQLR